MNTSNVENWDVLRLHKIFALILKERKLVHGQQKAGKASYTTTKQKTRMNILHLIRLISNRSVTCLGIKPEKKNNDPQCSISKTLDLSSSAKTYLFLDFSTVNNNNESIIPSWDCWALRQHCAENRPDSMKETTAWAQKHFWKSQSKTTVHCAVWKCSLNLYCATEKPNVNMIQKHCSK